MKADAAVAVLDIGERTHPEPGLHALKAIAEAAGDSRGLADSSSVSFEANLDWRHLRRVLTVARQALGCDHILLAEVDTNSECVHALIAVGGQPHDEHSMRDAGSQGWFGETLAPELRARLRAGEVVEMERPDVERWTPPGAGRSRMLLAPLRSGHHLIGILALDYGPQGQAFNEPEHALAGLTAHLVALELQREQLLREREEGKLRELSLEESARLMDDFFALAVHDLRSPLTAAVGGVDFAAYQFDRLAEAVLNRAPGLTDQVEAVRRRMNDTSKGMERLTRLVAMLFDTARTQAGTLDLHREPCDLVAIVREQLVSARQAHPHREIRVRVQARAPVHVLVDADRIGEVVTNYLTNALKYSPEDQRVGVRVQVVGAVVQVSVTDHGPGLPASERERIWQRFYRSPNVPVQSGPNSGLGLGLHICKSLIEAHGGQVGVASVVGRGSTFWFTLPLVSDAPGVDVSSATP